METAEWKPFKENRIGRVVVSRIFVERSDATLVLKLLFGNFFVVRAEFMFCNDTFEYEGFSEYFEPQEKYCKAPQYDFIFKKENGKTVLKGVEKCKPVGHLLPLGAKNV